jgi:hypothetical protein
LNALRSFSKAMEKDLSALTSFSKAIEKDSNALSRFYGGRAPLSRFARFSARFPQQLRAHHA